MKSIRFSRVFLVSLVYVVAAGCSTHRALEGEDNRPRIASVMPVAPDQDESVRVEVRMEEETAGGLLERGFRYLQKERYEAASDSFHSAIATGNLNDAGRALAYWQIAEAHRHLEDQDARAEALSSFTLVAEDVLAVRKYRRYAVDQDGDFVEHFNLVSRLAEARAFIAAAWAQRASHFGRSIDNPIVVRNPQEREMFIEFATRCERSNGAVSREAIANPSTVGRTGSRVERIIVNCNGRQNEEAFFIVQPRER